MVMVMINSPRTTVISISYIIVHVKRDIATCLTSLVKAVDRLLLLNDFNIGAELVSSFDRSVQCFA